MLLEPVRPRGWLSSHIARRCRVALHVPHRSGMCSCPGRRPASHSTRLHTMTYSDGAICRLHLAYALLSNGLVLCLAGLVVECCIDALVESASDRFPGTVDTLGGPFEIVADVAAGV